MMKTLMNLFALLSLLALATAVGCPTNNGDGDGDGDGDGGVEIIDGGAGDGDGDATGDGDGDTTGDGDGDTTGDGDGDGDTTGDGDGDGDTTGLDGGLPDIDAGLVSYSGEAEDGVRCGPAASITTCEVGAACCVTIDLQAQALVGTCSPAPSGNADGGVADGGAADAGAPADGEPLCPATGLGFQPFEFQCDDAARDCTGDDICCARVLADLSTFNLDGASDCRPQSECLQENDDYIVCTGDADCPDGLACCGLDVDVSVDMGVCRDAC